MLDSLLQLWPTPRSALFGGLWGLSLLLLAGGWSASGHRRGWRVGDTRKIFHFTIFTGAALLRWRVDGGAVIVYGVLVAGGVLVATWRGAASGLFNALARPEDAPYERRHVLAPLVCTAVGGVLAHLIAGSLAAVPYLVAGWGDAVGEPVGIRWGRHRYRVPAWGPATATRSWEGSAAIWLASTLAAGLGLLVSGRTGTEALVWAIPIGSAAAVIESVSPHGWDNLTLLVGVACVARLCIG